MVKGCLRRIPYNLFFILIFFFFLLDSQAQPKSEFVNAIWLAQEHNLLKISSATGQSLFQIPLVNDQALTGVIG